MGYKCGVGQKYMVGQKCRGRKGVWRDKSVGEGTSVEWGKSAGLGVHDALQDRCMTHCKTHVGHDVTHHSCCAQGVLQGVLQCVLQGVLQDMM